MTDPLLAIDNFSLVFETDEGTVWPVNHVSLSINKGEIMGLVGESGCGKSVTAMSILRLIPTPPGRIVSGRILFKGDDLLKLKSRAMRKIRGDKISMIFQEPMTSLSPLHRIGRQLIEAITLHREVGRAEAETIALEWLVKVGIPDARERMAAYPFQLSGGMQQRVMIAMAMMMQPDLIIADEPTTALDVTVQAQIFDLIHDMKETQTAILLITHDMGVVWEMCDRVAVMYASRIIEQGVRDAIFNAPLHPYTQGLLRSMPTLATPQKRLVAIPGQVPIAIRPPTHCPFFDRCAYAFAKCGKELPELVRQTEHHAVACFLAENKESVMESRT